MIDPDKLKLEMLDVEPYDLCDFSHANRFPDKESDQEMKEMAAKSPPKPTKKPAGKGKKPPFKPYTKGK